MKMINDDELKYYPLYIKAPLFIFNIGKGNRNKADGRKMNALSATDRLVFIGLYGASKGRTSKVSDMYLSSLLGISTSQIKRSMKHLEDNGLIERMTQRTAQKAYRQIRILKTANPKNAVHVPFEIYLFDLSTAEKLLLMQLVGISKKDGYTYITNDKLTEKSHHNSVRGVQKMLSQLEKKRYIKIEEIDHQRIISVSSIVQLDEIELDKNTRLREELEDIRQTVQHEYQCYIEHHYEFTPYSE